MKPLSISASIVLALLLVSLPIEAQQSNFPPFECLRTAEQTTFVYKRSDGSEFVSYDHGKFWHEKVASSDPTFRMNFCQSCDNPPLPSKIVYTRMNGENFTSYNAITWKQEDQAPIAVASTSQVKSRPDKTTAKNTKATRSSQSFTAVATAEARVLGIVPNPAQGLTTIMYHLSVDAQVQLSLWSLYGVEVLSIVDQYQKAGYHETQFRADQLRSGSYLYQLKVNGKVTTGVIFVTK